MSLLALGLQPAATPEGGRGWRSYRDEDVKASLRRMGLLGPKEECRLTSLTGGVSSVILRVDVADRCFCFKQALARLNVAAAWYAPVERNRAEVSWMRTADGILPGVAVRVLGEDLQANAFAMAYLDPAAWPLWKAELQAGRVDPAAAGVVGRVLSVLHAGTAGRLDVRTEFDHAADFEALRLEPYLLATGEHHADLAPRLSQIAERTGRTRLALVHGDVSPKNILLGGPQGAVLLDAETANYGDPAFDLGFCLNHLFLKALKRPQDVTALGCSVAAMLASYRSGLTWEPPAALEARLADLLPALMLARVDGKSPVEYLDRTGQAKVRAFARASLQGPLRRVEELWTAWSTEVDV